MEVVHSRCAGIDISKKDAKVCVRIQGRGRTRTAVTVTTWGAMSNQILALREQLLDEQVTCVVIEATSDYVRSEGASVKWEAPLRFDLCRRCSTRASARRACLRPGMLRG